MEALNKVKNRLGEESSNIKWLYRDISLPIMENSISEIDIWLDRAVLHFYSDKVSIKNLKYFWSLFVFVFKFQISFFCFKILNL